MKDIEIKLDVQQLRDDIDKTIDEYLQIIKRSLKNPKDSIMAQTAYQNIESLSSDLETLEAFLNVDVPFSYLVDQDAKNDIMRIIKKYK